MEYNEVTFTKVYLSISIFLLYILEANNALFTPLVI